MFEFLSVILKNAFQKPATRNYPAEVRAPYEKQKGHIVIDLPGCIYCGMCGRKCPTHAIEVKRADKSWSINRFRCIMCAACAESCPKKCLTMNGQYTAPAGAKTVDVFQMPDDAIPKPAPAAKPAPAVGVTESAAKGENKGA